MPRRPRSDLPSDRNAPGRPRARRDSEHGATKGEPADGRERLQKVLAAAGCGSRRHCEEFITTGRVAVNGRVVRELGVRVQPGVDKIQLDGEPVRPQRKVYYLVNKPPGYVSTHNDPQRRPRVIDLIPPRRERLFTVGRLDANSQGLMIVTNDGALAQRLAHPRYGIAKTYRVLVAGAPDAGDMAALEQGMIFAEGRFRARSVRILKPAGNATWLEIVLTEGQNREIRRMLARLEHKVMRLQRVALGPFRLRDLPLGGWREVSPAELQALAGASAKRDRFARPRKGGAGGKPAAGARGKPPRSGTGAPGRNRGDSKRRPGTSRGRR